MFGRQNSKITEVYSVANKDIYASITLGTPTTATHRGWLEITDTESRAVGGDTWARTAIFISDVLDSLAEGDIVTIQEDQLGVEPSPTNRKWRIENKNIYYGFVRMAKRTRRMELNLREEAS